MAKDIFNVQRGVVGRGVGDDTYIISPALVDAGANIIISDASGLNTVQLIGGLQIASSRVASTALELTLSNGAKVTVLGAQNFQYIVGGNPLTGDSPAATSFAAFTSETLGVTVPTSGLASGTAKSIGVDMFDQADLDAAAASSEALAAAEAEVAELTEDLAEAAADLTAAQAQVTDLTADLATVTATRDALQSDLDTLNADYDALLASSAVTAEDLIDAQAGITALTASLADAEAEVATLTAQLNAANAQIATLEGELATAEDTIADLEELVDQYEAAEEPTIAALTTATDSFTGTGAGDKISGATFTVSANNTVSKYDTVTDGVWGDGDTLTITAEDDLGAEQGINVINIETVNLTLTNTVTGGTKTTFEIDAANIAKSDIVISATADGVPSVDIDNVASGSSVTTGAKFTEQVDIDGDVDGILTVTSAAEKVNVNGSAGDLETVTATLSSAEDLVMVTDAVDTVTVTATATEALRLDAAKAETVTVTSSGSIDVASVSLAADNITLSAKNEVVLTATAATEATISAGAAADGKAESVITSSTITALNLSGNGSAPTFALDGATGAPGVTDIAISGTQDVTVVADIFDINALTADFTVTDTSSGESTLILEGTGGAKDADLSKVGTDFIQLNFDNAGSILTFASGDDLTVTTNLTAQTFIGLAASAGSNRLDVTLDDLDAANASAPSLTGLTIDDIAHLTVNANVDDGKSLIDGLTASLNNTNVTFNIGSQGIKVDGTVNVGGGSLTFVGGNGEIDGLTAVITAGELVVDGTSKLVVDSIDSTKLDTITSDEGADEITVTDSTKAMTIATGAADDRVSVTDGTIAASKFTIDFGAGTKDTLVLTAAETYKALSVVASNLEVISVTGDVTIGSDLVSGKTYAVNDGGAGATKISLEMPSLVTSFNLSSLTLDDLGAGDQFFFDGSASAASFNLVGVTSNTVASNFDTGTGNDTITGGNGADDIDAGAGNNVVYGLGGNDLIETYGATVADSGNDTVFGGEGNDTIKTGKGNDTIDAGNGQDLIEAGEGADTIILTEATAATDTVYYDAFGEGSARGTLGGTFSGYDNVVDFDLVGGTADKIDIAGITGGAAGKFLDVSGTAATNPLNDLSLSNYLDINQVVNFFNDAGVGFDGNTGAGGDLVAAVRVGSGTGQVTAIYAFDDAGANIGVVEADEVFLLAVVDDHLAVGFFTV